MKKHFYYILAMAMTAVLFCGCGAPSGTDPFANEPDMKQGAEQNEGTDAAGEDTANEAVTETETAQTGQTAAEQDQDDAADDSGGESVPDVTEQKKDESPATGYMAGDHERTLDGIKAYLGTLSAEAEEFAKAGGLALNWNSVAGMRNLLAFEERYVAGEETEIVIMQYTDEGDPIFDYLYYDGQEVWYVRDNSRDKWGGPEGIYWEARYPFVLFFTQKAEERDRMHSIVLSKKDGMTYDECTQIFMGNGNGDEIPAVMFLTSFFYTDADL